MKTQDKLSKSSCCIVENIPYLSILNVLYLTICQYSSHCHQHTDFRPCSLEYVSKGERKLLIYLSKIQKTKNTAVFCHSVLKTMDHTFLLQALLTTYFKKNLYTVYCSIFDDRKVFLTLRQII